MALNTTPSTKARLGLHLDFPARVTAVNLEFAKHLDYDDWKQTLFKVVQIGNWSNWAMGAVLVEGEARYGETYAQAVTEAGISPDRAMACKYVYERIPDLIRIKELKWSIHREIAPLDTLDSRQYWLTECHKHAWTVVELKEKLIEAGLRKTRQPRLEKPPGEQSRDTIVEVDGCDSCGSLPVVGQVCRACMAIIKFDAKGVSNG